MDRARRRPRHRALAVVLATLLVPLVVGSTAAAPPGSRPAVNVTAGTPSGGSLSVTAAVNRGTKDLASCTYVIDTGTATACLGTLSSDGKKASHYTIALSNQSVGGHTITVTVRLKDGGKASDSDTFTIAAPPVRRFVVAFSNLDGIAGYDPDADQLIAELVDGNGDNVANVGDIVNTASYPIDLEASSFADFGVPTWTVPAGASVSSDSGGISILLGQRYYSWWDRFSFDAYTEELSATTVTTIVDRYTVGGFNSDHDTIAVNPGSPSQPETAVSTGTIEGAAADDDAFIDVIITP